MYMENCTAVNVNGEKNIFECVNRTFLFFISNFCFVYHRFLLDSPDVIEN